jgi:hypothetical protein
MFEIFLASGVLICLVVRDVMGLPSLDQPIVICGGLLAIIYLLANWWTNKPKEKTPRTIIVTSLYGLTSCSLTFTLVFKFLYLTGSDQITILSLILIIVTLAIDIISSGGKTKVINSWTMWRLGIMTTLAAIYFFVPESRRVPITYKKYPDFIKYYESNRDSLEFYDIRNNYFLVNENDE